MRIVTMVFIMLGMAACGPNVSSTSNGGGPGADGPSDDDAGDVGDAGPSTPDVGEVDPCGEGEDICDGLCVDLQSDDEHCGDCGNACENVANLGGCEQGVCPPNYECGGDRTDYADCAEVCAALGTTCEDGIGCSGYYQLFYDLQGVENCEAGVGGSTEWGSCTDPIDWKNPGGLNLTPPVAVSCCCLQG